MKKHLSEEETSVFLIRSLYVNRSCIERIIEPTHYQKHGRLLFVVNEFDDLILTVRGHVCGSHW